MPITYGIHMKQKKSIHCDTIKTGPSARSSDEKSYTKGWKRPRKMIRLKSEKSALDFLLEERNCR